MREALEYAVDKDKIAKALGYGFVKPVYEIIMGINEVGNPGTTPRKYNRHKLFPRFRLTPVSGAVIMMAE